LCAIAVWGCGCDRLKLGGLCAIAVWDVGSAIG
jgi:hypothetical protein